MKSFDSWTFEDVELAFHIEKIKDLPLLVEWLKSEKTLDNVEMQMLERYRNNIYEYVDTWNEDELKLNFIGPLLSLVNYTSKNYKTFSQRTLRAQIDEYEMEGHVDFMVATGKIKPREPFFFFHEYKPSKRGINDPMGQLLIEMVSAQSKNTKEHPIFGVLVEGRFWYFIILDEKKYAVSNPYDACDVDIYKIYAILHKIKEYIEEFLKI